MQQCAHCSRICQNCRPGSDTYADEVFCSQCWEEWEKAENYHSFGPSFLPGQAVEISGAVTVHCTLGEGVRAVVVDPYVTEVDVLVQAWPVPVGQSKLARAEEGVLVSVHRSRLSAYRWQAAARTDLSFAGQSRLASSLQLLLIEELQASINSAGTSLSKCMHICDLGCGSGEDAVRFAEALNAEVHAVVLAEELMEVLAAPGRGRVVYHDLFDILCFCDLVLPESQGWRSYFDLFWANASLHQLHLNELHVLLSSLHFCAKPGCMFAAVIPLGHNTLCSDLGYVQERQSLVEDDFTTLFEANCWMVRQIKVVQQNTCAGQCLNIVAVSHEGSGDVIGPGVRGILRYHLHGSHVQPGKLAQNARHAALMPDKFLRFVGTRMIDLQHDDNNAWLDSLLRDACGLSTFKDLEGQNVRWCLRANPSAGALQPNEVYVIADQSVVQGWHGRSAALFHYHAFWHALEVLTEIPCAIWGRIRDQLPSSSSVETVLVALTALYWRTAWKYGDVAFHAVQRDTGHTMACFGYAALAANARCLLVEVDDDTLAGLLGLHDRAANAQQPHALLAVVKGSGKGKLAPMRLKLPKRLLPLSWVNNISDLAYGGYLPQAVADGHCATWKSCVLDVQNDLVAFNDTSITRFPSHTLQAEHLRALIRNRRSVVGFDTEAPISQESMQRILLSSLPWQEPLASLLPFAHPLVPLMLISVQRVTGLTQGLYAVVRDTSCLSWLQETCFVRHFLWQPVHGCLGHLPFFFLAPGDLGEVMQTAALGQPIAGQAAVVVMFFAAYKPALKQHGAWLYRRMLWEAGAAGHALWLAAEAEGLRGAAIGAFFGPWTHEVFGVDPDELRDLYHFSFGVPTEEFPFGDDSRFLPPYEHLKHLRSQGGRDQVDTRESRIVQVSVSGQLGQRTGMPWDYKF